MPIEQVAICDVCGKQIPMTEANDFFMVNVAHVYCSIECYEKQEMRDVKRT